MSFTSNTAIKLGGPGFSEHAREFCILPGASGRQGGPTLGVCCSLGLESQLPS